MFAYHTDVLQKRSLMAYVDEYGVPLLTAMRDNIHGDCPVSFTTGEAPSVSPEKESRPPLSTVSQWVSAGRPLFVTIESGQAKKKKKKEKKEKQNAQSTIAGFSGAISRPSGQGQSTFPQCSKCQAAVFWSDLPAHEVSCQPQQQ